MTAFGGWRFQNAPDYGSPQALHERTRPHKAICLFNLARPAPALRTLKIKIRDGSMQSKKIKIGILNISDRASKGVYADLNGPAIESYLEEILTTPWSSIRRVIPDGTESVRNHLVDLADNENCALILTSGGTGPAPRDLTPEATQSACTMLLPGFGELMRTVSLRQVPTAILSRQTAGIRGSTLIVNLPGRPSSIRLCLDAVFPAIPYCLDLIGRPGIETNPQRCAAFRPG